MEFSSQEYWSVEPFPHPKDLSTQEIKPGSPALQADSVPSETPEKTLGINTRNKASLGNRISAELFKILNDDAMEVLPSL